MIWRYLVLLCLLSGCAELPKPEPKAGPDPAWFDCPSPVVAPDYQRQNTVGELIADYDLSLKTCQTNMKSLHDYLTPQ